MNGWTTDKPSIGTYWLSIHPDKRLSAGANPYPAVIKCKVALFSPGRLFVVEGVAATKHVREEGGGYWRPLDQDWFQGAQWKPVEADPTDPFEPKPRNWGAIACESGVSPETIAWAAARDKQLAEINKKLGR